MLRCPNPPHCFPRSIQVLCLSCLFLGALQPALGDNLVWDFDAVTPVAQDGTGTWTLGQPNWFNQTQTLDNQVWVNGSNAIFGAGSGAAGTVTLGGPITVGDLTFNAAGSGSYTITGDTLTLGSGAVVVNSSATINSILAGSNGLAKSGGGQLTLGGSSANTYSGLMTLSAGRLHLAKTAGINAVTGNLTISGGADVTFAANNQIADTATVTMSDSGSTFNGTSANSGLLSNIQETFRALTVTGGAFNTSAGGSWTITEMASFTGGSGNTIFVGNSSGSMNVGGLTLVNMTEVAGGTVVTNNSFTLYGNSTATVSTLRVGSLGLTLDGSRLNMRRGSSSTKGSRLILNGNVATTGTSISRIVEDTAGGTNGILEIQLSSTAGAHTRTFNIAGGGADLIVGIGITNGAATSGGIIKAGVGMLTLSGANTYTGTTSVTAGTLLFATRTALYNNVSANWTATNLTVASGATAAFNVGGTNEFTAGDIDLIKVLGNGGSGGFLTGARLGFDASNAGGPGFTYSTVIGDLNSGANVIGVDILGTGTVIFDQANTYTGGTNLLGGALQAQNVNALSSGAITFRGGTLRYTAASSGTDWAAQFKHSTSAISIDTNGENVTLAGVIDSTNTGGLAKTGEGTLTLAGSNTFTGTTTVGAGTLKLEHSNALVGSTFAGGAGALSFGSLTAATFGGLTGSSGLALINDSTAAVALTVGGNDASTSYSGVLSGAGSLIKNGTGTLTLAGGSANTFTGLTIINNGTLLLNRATGVTAVAGDIVVNAGGVLQLSTSHQIADTAGITFNGGTMTGWSTDETLAFLTQNSGGLASSGNTGHITITGALTLAGGDQLVINSNNGSNNPASWDVGSAILTGANILIGGSNGTGKPRTSLTIGAGGLTMQGRTITMNRGTAGVVLNLNGDFTGTGTNSITVAVTGAVDPLLHIGAASRNFNVINGTTTISVEISGAGGSFVKTGAGLMQLTAANTYSGLTTVSRGTLSIAGADGRLLNTSGIVVNNGGTFQNGSPTDANNNGVANRINSSVGLTLEGGTFNHRTAAAGAHTQELVGLTISGGSNIVNVTAIAGTTATLTFTGANPYTRTAGTVSFVQNPGDGGSIVFTNAPSGAGNVSGGLLVGATLNGTDLIAAQSGVLTAFAGWTPTGTSTWTNNASMDVNGSNPVAYTTETINALRFNTAGAFTLTLDGTHTLSSGMLLVTPTVGANLSTITGGELRGPAGGELVVAQFNTAGSLALNSTIIDNTSATALVKTGGGVLILSGSNSYTGVTRVNEGVLRAADGVGLSSGSALVLNGGVFESTASTFARALGTAAGQVALTMDTTGFSAAGTAVAVNLGGSGATIQWGGANFDPAALLLNASTATAALNFQNGLDLNGATRTIRVDANAATISGVISDSASSAPAGLIKLGNGTLVLSQANTFGGGIMISAGTVGVGNNGALGTGDINLNGGTLRADGASRTLSNNIAITSSSTLGGSQTLTLNGVITGASTLNKSSSSVVELGGHNLYTGVTNVTNGILRLLSNDALGATSSGTTASGSGTVQLADGVVVTGETITISSTFGSTGDGSPASSRGALQAGVNATAEWAGNIVIGGNQARIGVQEGGTLLVSGNITDGSNSYTLRLSGELSGTGGVIISGTGNAWDGETHVVRGTVTLGAHNTLPTTTTLDIHFSNTNNNEYAGLDLNGFNQTVGSLKNGGSTGSNAELTNKSRTFATFTVNETGSQAFEGIITGNLALVKNGAGTTTLSRSNSFSGGLTVNDGVLRIADSGALAGGNVTVNGGAGAAGKLDLNNTSTTINSLNGAAGAVSAIIANESTTAATRTLTVGVNHGSGAFAGNIVDNTGGAALGVVALTKIGTGTLTLTGANTFTGATSLSNGTVIADFTTAAALNATSPVNMQGGELIISGATTASIGAVTLVQGSSTFTANILRVQDGATVTTSALNGQSFASLLVDLTGGGTFVASSLSGIVDTNGVLGQGGSQRATIYVQDDSGVGFGTQNGSNEIVRYTGATTADATNSSSTTNFIISSDLTRTAELAYNTLQIDTTAGDVTLDIGSHDLSVGAVARGVLISGTNDALITGTSGKFNGSSVFVSNFSTGTTTIDVSLAGNALVSNGPGLVVYTKTANPNDLYAVSGVLRMTGGDRTYGNSVVRIYGGGILELGADTNGAADGDFTRASGQIVGGVGLIGNGGFSAHGADRVVALGGVASPTALTWGAGDFFSGPDGDNNYAFKLGSAYSTHTLEFQNAIDLGGLQRMVEVADGVDATNVDGRLTGVLSGAGGGLVKTGSGTLELTAANTYTGSTVVQEGVLQIASTGRTGTGEVTIASGGAISGSGVVQGSDFTLAAGGVLHAGDGTLPGNHGTLSFTPNVGGGSISLQGSVILDLTSANSVDATFGGNEVGSAGYISYVNDVSRSLGLGSGSHDLLVFNPAGDAKGYTLDFLTTGGTLQVLGSGGFTPEKGQVFNLLDWSGVTADFTGFDLGTNFRSGRDSDGNEGAFDLPDLFAAGLLWDVSQFTTSGIIVVVPEPSRMLLLLAGLAVTAFRRRR